MEPVRVVEEPAAIRKPRLALNRMIMELGHGVTLATNNFAALIPAWLVGNEALEEVELPEGVPPPACWVKDDRGMLYPCWQDPEVINKFLRELSQGTGTWA